MKWFKVGNQNDKRLLHLALDFQGDYLHSQIAEYLGFWSGYELIKDLNIDDAYSVYIFEKAVGHVTEQKRDISRIATTILKYYQKHGENWKAAYWQDEMKKSEKRVNKMLLSIAAY